MGKWSVLVYSKIPINNCGRMEGMREIENKYYLNTIIIVADKIHQLIVKLVNEKYLFEKKNSYRFKVCPPKYIFINHKEKIVKLPGWNLLKFILINHLIRWSRWTSQ